MPGQADRIINAMKDDSSINIETDWKIITLFIGGNDLCQYCRKRVSIMDNINARMIKAIKDLVFSKIN